MQDRSKLLEDCIGACLSCLLQHLATLAHKVSSELNAILSGLRQE